jgi:ubiquitin carboxyl-terminal hydrolase 34
MVGVFQGAVGILLENGFFIRCLEIIWLDQEDRMRLRGKYANYLRLIEKGRSFSYRHMMALCAVFFKKINLALPLVRDDDNRLMSDDLMYPMSVTESKFVRPLEDDGGLSILAKILQHDYFGCTKASYTIVAALVQSEPQAGLLQGIIKMLQTGLRLSPADLSIPFLEAAYIFCKWCPGKTEAANLIDFVAKGVESIDGRASIDHLEFFARVSTTSNERLGLGPDWFSAIVQDRIPNWAPTLLIDNDRSVREGCMEIVHTLLISNENLDITEDTQARYQQIGRDFMFACVHTLEKAFINSQVQQVESRIVEGIIEIIKRCQNTYFDIDNDEHRQIVDVANETLTLIQDMTIEVEDDLVSESDLPSADEWEAASALASDSEMGVAGSP